MRASRRTRARHIAMLNRRGGRVRRDRLQVEEVEPRVLYSADAVGGLIEPPGAAPTPGAVRLVVADADASLQAAASGRATEIVVVDAAVPDAQRLVDAIHASRGDARLEVVQLDPARDGLAQITDLLRDRRDVAALHLVAHGEAGAMTLSGERIDAAAIDAARADLAAWRDAFTADADLLLYGCDLAASGEGIDLLARLARYTGTDVAASDDATGSRDAGGDWVLESRTGAIEARALFDGDAADAWHGLLAAVAQAGEQTVYVGSGDQQAVYAQRSVAVAPDGSSLVVFQYDTGGSYGVRAQRFDAAGSAVGGTIVVNTTMADDQMTPEVAATGDGSWLVVWSSDQQDGSGWGVYGQYVNADGTLRGGEFRVNQTATGNQDRASVAMDPMGGAVIAWQSDQGGTLDVYARRYDAAGSALGNEFRVNTTTAIEQENPKVAVAGDGRFAIAWQSTGQDGSSAGVFMRLYAADGTPDSGEIQVNTTTLDNQVLPDVAIDADGLVVTWMSENQDGSGYGIYARQFDAGGTALSGEIRVNAYTSSAQENPQVVRTAGGGFVVAWESDGQDGDARGVYLRQFDADGVALTGDQRINATTASWQGQVSIASSASGRLHAVWTSAQNGDNDVFMRRYRLTEPGVLVVDTTSDAGGGDTSSIAALQANRGGDGRISLREAIDAANNDPTAYADPIRILFAIPTTDTNYSAVTGVFTITTSGLPSIDRAMTLDASSQARFVGDSNAGTLGAGGTVGVGGLALDPVERPEIALVDGGGAAWGIDIAAADVTVNGFAIHGFDWVQVLVRAGAHRATIEDNIIGTGPTAFTDPGPGVRAPDTGVLSEGGDDGTLRNNLIGFTDYSLVSLASDSDGWTIEGNELRGGSLLHAWYDTLAIDGSNVLVRGNLMIDGYGTGIDVYGTSSNVTLVNNTIDNVGYATTSEDHTVWVYQASSATIDRNVIRNAATTAIAVMDTARAVITRNSIDGSGGLGIDLDNDGVTANDNDDVDGGPSGRQNFAVLSSASSSGGNSVIVGSLNSEPNRTFRIEFFSSPTANASGHGEGLTYIGEDTVVTDANGDATFVSVLTGVTLVDGHHVTATVTRATGGFAMQTSEFSQSVAATTPTPGITVTPVDTATSEAGATGSFTVVLNSAPSANVTIPVSVSSAGEATVSTVLLTFTTANWNVAQTVTVTGVDDPIVDGDRPFTVVLGAATSADGAYGGMNAADVAMTNVDDDTRSTITVTTTSDVADGNVTNLDMLHSNRGADGEISLREALLAANASANGPGGSDIIRFDIPDALVGGRHTITLASALPAITQAIEIDAGTEPQWAGTPVVYIDGSGIVALTSGLVFETGASGSALYGLGIIGFNRLGVVVNGADNLQIGAANRGNLIADNGNGSIDFMTGSTGNRVQGNALGTDFAGSPGLGNGDVTIRFFSGANDNLVGGTAAGQGNFIWNTVNDAGIAVLTGATNNAILGNSFDGNFKIGIQLQGGGEGADAVTPNDLNDVDTGANDLQNFPVLVSASAQGADTRIVGSLDSTAGNYRIEFFSSPTADPSGHGEGRTFLGAIDVTIVGTSDVYFDILLPGINVTAGHVVSATATRDLGGGLWGGTSEFAQNVVATSGLPPVVSGSGGSTTYVENAAPVVVDAGLALVDTDSTNLSGATVRISVNHAASEDELVFVDQGGITGSWNAGTGTLTLSGTASVATYRTALQSVAYRNLSDAPSTATRTIAFNATDAEGNTSADGTRSLTVTAVNDAPVLAPDGGSIAYVEGAAAERIHPGVTVADADSANFAGGTLTVTLTANGHADDRVSIVNLDAPGPTAVFLSLGDVTYGGVSVGTAAGGTGATPFTVTFNASADATAVQAVLRAVRFWAVGDGPSVAARTVTFVLTDGDGGTSSTVTRGVTVTGTQDAPTIVSGSGATAAYSIAENTTAVALVTGSDPDQPVQSLAWSIVGGDDAARFTLVGATGPNANLRFVAPPDRDAPDDLDGDGVYHVTLQFTDGIDVVTQAVTVTVTDVDEFDAQVPVDVDATPNQVSEGAANGSTVGLTARGIDADATATVTYSLADTSGGRFAIDPVTGVVTVADGSLIDAESASAYSIAVRTLSSDGSEAFASFAISVASVNEFPPTITSDGGGPTAAFSLTENADVVTTALAVDGDVPADALSWSIVGGADAGRFAIDAVTGVLRFAAPPDFEVPADADGDNVYQATIRVTDGVFSDTQAISVTITDGNEAPVGAITDADAGADQVSENAANGSTVGLVAFATDPDPTATVSYTLDDDAGGRFSVDAATGVVRVLDGTRLDREAAASHAIVVRATSTDGSSSTRAFTITVLDVDEFDVGPIGDGDAIANQVAEDAVAGTAVNLTAQASDPDATAAVAFSLDDDAGGRFTIDAATGVVRTGAVALDYETATTHNIVVRATSTDGSSSTAAFAIAVQPVNDTAPVITSNGGGATGAASVVENTALVTVATATDGDVPTQTLTWSLGGGADVARFTIDPGTGALSFNVAPDADLPADLDGDNVYQVVIRVTDGLFTDTQALSVTVTDVDESVIGPMTDVDLAANQVAEGAAAGTVVGFTGRAVDPDWSATVVYSLDDDAGGRFTIDAATGVVRVANGLLLDREAAASHTIVVRGTSSDSSLAIASFAIAVTDVDESDVGPITDTDAAADAVAENAAAGTVVGITARAIDPDATATVGYALDDDAGGRFVIDAASGVVRVAAGAVLDHEAATSHAIVVRATSSDGSSTTLARTVSVLPVNDNTPVITSDGGGAAAAVGVVENTTAVTTGTATDADLPAQALTWSIAGGADAARFTIDASTGVLRFVAAPDREAPDDANADGTYLVTIQVSDGTQVDTQALTVAVTDADEFDVGAIADTDPTVDAVGENAAAGTTVGLTARAVDADATATVAYALDVDAGGRFAIDAASGVVRVAAGAPLDHETAASHAITVRATSSDGSFSTRVHVIAVLPVNDNPPVITSDGGGATAARSVAENTTAVTTGTATDADLPAPVLAWSIAGGADAARFTIDAASGALSFVAPPDREAAADANGDHVYEVTVAVSDGAFSDTQALSVTVTDADESDVGPVADVDAGQDRVAEGAATGTTVGVTARGVDADATATIVYTLDDDAGGRFSIDAATGIVRVADGTRLDYETTASHAITVRATSSDGSTATASFTVALLPVTDAAPVITSDGGGATAAVAAVENATAVTVATATDADLPAQALTWSIAGGADAARFVIDPATGALRFVTAPDFEAPTDAGADNVYDVTIRVTDGTFADLQAIAVTVADANESPGFVVPGPQTVVEDTWTPIAGVALVDPESNAATVRLQAANGLVDLTLNPGVTVVAGALGSNTVTVAGTQAQLDAVLATLRYRGAPDRTGPDVLTLTATDAGGLTGTATIAITLTPVNDATELLRNLGIEVAERGAVRVDDVVVAFNDVDDTAAQITIRVDAAPTAGELTLQGTLLGVGDTFTQADLDLGRVEYRHTAPGTFTDAIVLNATDGQGSWTGPVTVAVTIDAVNDAPRLIAPTAVATTEDVPIRLGDATGTRIIATDDASVSEAVELRLSASGGATLSLATTAALTFVSGDGSGDADMVFRGTLFAVNRALDGLLVTPAADMNGTVLLTVLIDDLGATGSGGPLAATTSVAVTVASVNDAPVLGLPAAQTIPEDAVLAFGSAGAPRLTLADVDAAAPVRLNLAVDAGTLSIGPVAGLTWLAGDGVDDSVIAIEGTPAQLQAALDALVFRPAADWHGAVALDLMVDDRQGAVAQGRVAITVAPVDDLPVATVPAAQALRSDGTIEFAAAAGTAVTLADADGSNPAVVVDLTVGGGRLTVAAPAAVAVESAAGPAGGTALRLSGPLDAVNLALATLRYQPNLTWFGTTALEVTVASDDGSGTMAVGAPKSMPIVVSPIGGGAGGGTGGGPVIGGGGPGSSGGGDAPVGTGGGSVAPVVVTDVGGTTSVGSGTADSTQAALAEAGARAGGPGNGLSAILGSAARTRTLVPTVLPDVNAPLENANEVAARIVRDAQVGLDRFERGAIGAGVAAQRTDVFAWLVVTPESVMAIVPVQTVDAPSTRAAIDVALDPEQAVRGERERAADAGLEITLAQGAQVAGVALTAGAVWWAVYGGTTLWILMAAGPLARTFDPLPVLARDRDRDADAPRDAADALFDDERDDAPLIGTSPAPRNAVSLVMPA